MVKKDDQLVLSTRWAFTNGSKVFKGIKSRQIERRRIFPLPGRGAGGRCGGDVDGSLVLVPNSGERGVVVVAPVAVAAVAAIATNLVVLIWS